MRHQKIDPRPALLAATHMHASGLRGGLRLLDDPLTVSSAWPGANPALMAAGGGDRQLSLALASAWRHDGERGGVPFDASVLDVRTLPSEGLQDTLDSFLGRWHYSGSRGFPGPSFGLYSGQEMVGVCTFARPTYHSWGRSQFRPLETDLERVRLGLMGDHGLSHRLVNESECLELNRLALKPPTETTAPLGRGASSWFVARCLQWFDRRNRDLWSAVARAERGLPLHADERALVEAARIGSDSEGTSFLKTVVSFADPWEGHVGLTYQALGFHHAGRSNDGRWQTVYLGERSGDGIHKRTRVKALGAPDIDGHDTAVLRLVWEGGEAEVRVLQRGRLVEVSDGRWVRGEIGDGAFDRVIQHRWRQWQSRMKARHGADLQFEVRHIGGGMRTERRPPKHRYIRMMGGTYWQHELERRCVHLRERMRERDARWLAQDGAPEVWWRGSLPDTRSMRDASGVSLYYPQDVEPHELKPTLRRRAEGWAA